MFIDVVGEQEFTWTGASDACFVAVIGSRRRNEESDREQVLRAVVAVLEREVGRRPVVFVSGGCRKGADRHIELFVEATELTLVRFLPRDVPAGSPHWARTRALHDRNTRIVTLAGEVLAQVAPDRTGGTEDGVKKAHRLGRSVTLLNPDGTLTVEHPPVSKRRSRVVK